MKLIEALEWRYAVKKMNGNKIPADKLNTIIEATRLAPSAFGLTPYTIIVVEDDEIRKKLHPAFYNQSQVVDCSAVIIFAAWNSITEKEVGQVISPKLVNEYASIVKSQAGAVDLTNLLKNYFKPGKVIEGDFYKENNKLLLQGSIKDGLTDKTLISFENSKVLDCNKESCSSDALSNSVLRFKIVCLRKRFS